MAYVIDLEDEMNDTDIPTTLIRSKADVPLSDGDITTTLSTNDIVINKLAQILSYLRQGPRSKKSKKKVYYYRGRITIIGKENFFSLNNNDYNNHTAIFCFTIIS